MTYCSVVTVLALVGLTKKRFGHYAVSKILSLRSPRYVASLNKICGVYCNTYSPPLILVCFPFVVRGKNAQLI